MSMKPLMKYVGGKSRLAADIMDHVPLVMTEYHEPFVGGGALFCAMHDQQALKGVSRVSLSDANADVMDLYRAVQDSRQVEALLGDLLYLQRKYMHPKYDQERMYYDQRDLWNSGDRTPGRLIFLRQTAYSGLYRENLAGELNVSWGKYPTINLLDEDNIRAWHTALQGVELRTGSYAELDPGPGAVVYADPPYYASFDGYTAAGFKHADHVQLLNQIWKWRNAGALVLCSNSSDPTYLNLLKILWPTVEHVELKTKYMVNCDGEGRTEVLELLLKG